MNLEVTHVRGGMREFERTGIYPEYLLFNLPGSRLNWTIKIKGTSQTGVLKSKGRTLYEYSFDGNVCRLRKADPDGSFSKWFQPEFMISELRD